jgi:phosphoglycerate kinase
MSYTFLKAQGIDVGSSILDAEMIAEAQKILKNGKDRIFLPQDFRCAPEYADVAPTIRTVTQGLHGVMGLDIGDQTLVAFGEQLIGAQTVF